MSKSILARKATVTLDLTASSYHDGYETGATYNRYVEVRRVNRKKTLALQEKTAIEAGIETMRGYGVFVDDAWATEAYIDRHTHNTGVSRWNVRVYRKGEDEHGNEYLAFKIQNIIIDHDGKLLQYGVATFE